MDILFAVKDTPAIAEPSAPTITDSTTAITDSTTTITDSTTTITDTKTINPYIYAMITFFILFFLDYLKN
jgi:hypothetical protein